MSRYSRPALNELDRKLERYLDFDGGFFVEAGANDGFQQSNTYYFERMRGWRGILIEPIPMLFEKCRRLRKRSEVVQAALVGPEFTGAQIDVEFAGLMSVTAGAFDSQETRARHIEAASSVGQLDVDGSYTVSVPALTLSRILDRAARGVEIDLLSLDVEGAELSALAGLDLSRHRPRFICVEARDTGRLLAILGEVYELVEVLTENSRYRDLLFRRR